jgi:hypothetical protein
LINLYKQYNNIPQIDLFVRQAKELFPELNCGLASIYLKDKLKKGIIVQGTYAGENHTFLLINQIVIDITADQYGGPEVYVGPLEEPWKLS